MSRFTEVLAEHRLMFVEGVGGDLHWCVGCMDRALPHEFDSIAAHAAHVESMLVEAGVVAVELPDADEVGDGFETWNGREVTATIGSDKVRCYLEDPRMTADDARELAAVLLAAAAAAVRPVTPEEPR